MGVRQKVRYVKRVIQQGMEVEEQKRGSFDRLRDKRIRGESHRDVRCENELKERKKRLREARWPSHETRSRLRGKKGVVFVCIVASESFIWPPLSR